MVQEYSGESKTSFSFTNSDKGDFFEIFRKLSLNKKIVLFIFLVILLLGIVLTIYLSQQQQDLRQRAANVPKNEQTKTIKILVMSYFPLDSTGLRLDPSISGINETLSEMRLKVESLTEQGMQVLSEGTQYHGYKQHSPAALDYIIGDKKEYLKRMPRSDFQAWSNPAYRPDYRKMLTEDVNICDYVDGQGILQVWVWGYHFGDIEPDESNMSMGRLSQQYWNHVSYGDISNGQQLDDLPICNKTYVLYNYNYAAGLGNVLEDHGHHMERVMGFVDPVLWDKFENPHGDTNAINHCGWTHSPPNVSNAEQYFWHSEATVRSDCEDWKPDGGGEVKQVNCHTWYGATCRDTGGIEYKKWWMQNMPSISSNLTFGGKKLRSWWEFYADLDAALVKGKISVEEPPTSTSTPTPVSPTAILTTPTPTSLPPTPTQVSTSTPAPTNTLIVSGFHFNFDITLQGIGSGVLDNSTPVHPQRELTVTVFKEDNTPAFAVPVRIQVAYNTSTKRFVASDIGLAAIFPEGNYSVKVSTPGYLTKRIPGIFQLRTTQLIYNFPQITLTAGDINGDNKIDIKDYTLYRECYGKQIVDSIVLDGGSISCSLTDLNDDERIDSRASERDYLLLLASFSQITGD